MGKRAAEDSTSAATPEVTTENDDHHNMAMVPFAGNKADNNPETVTNAEKINLFEGEVDGEDKNPTLTGTPQKNTNRKKLRGRDGQAVDSNKSSANDLGSATPLEGDRREQ